MTKDGGSSHDAVGGGQERCTTPPGRPTFDVMNVKGMTGSGSRNGWRP